LSDLSHAIQFDGFYGDARMSFKITIEQDVTTVRTVGNDWQIVEQSANGAPKYGYTPAVEKEITRTVQVYEQTVETLDIAAVIAVVNRMGAKEH
jgi:hypothetical protein